MEEEDLDNDMPNFMDSSMLPMNDDEPDHDSLLSKYLINRATASDFAIQEVPIPIVSSSQTSLTCNENYAWRTRDPIYSLIQNRKKMLKKLHIPYVNGDGNDNGLIMDRPSSVTQSNKFDILSSLESVKDDSLQVYMVQNAFSIAAMSVVHALKHQLKQMKEYEEEENEEEQNTQKIPPLLHILDNINEIKNECFDISLNNVTNVSSSSSASRKRKSSSTSSSTQPNDSTTSTLSSSTKKRRSSTSSTGGSKTITLKKGKSTSSASNTPSTTTSQQNQTNSTSSIDSRLSTSRAILCSAASIVFKKLTPKYDDDDDENDINILDVPQNTHQSTNDDIEDDMSDDIDSKTKASQTAAGSKKKPSINMGAVTMSAEIFAKRSIEQALSSVKRSENRRKWKMDCAKRVLLRKEGELTCSRNSDRTSGREQEYRGGLLEKWLTWNDCSSIEHVNCVSDGSSDEEEDNDFGFGTPSMSSSILNKYNHSDLIHQSEEWTMTCLPRIIDVMNVGPGHVILHDLQWKTRFQRVLEILTGLATHNVHKANQCYKEQNYGPHLIMTTEADFGNFMGSLAPLDYTVRSDGPFYLRSLGYSGDTKTRHQIRKEHFTSICLSGLIDAPYNVVVTTYKAFIEDYVHFCQIPFQAVILDDGMSWLGTAHYDPNGQLGKVFDKGIWNQSDNHAGLAGVGYDDWDFSGGRNSQQQEGTEQEKRKLIGLTARHRIIIASSMHSKYREVSYSAPVPGLLSFFFPQFADVVREEWDRSRIQNCVESVEHIRKLLCRSIVIYTGLEHSENMYSLALSSMTGKLGIDDPTSTLCTSISDTDSLEEKDIYVSTDTMIADGKIVQSRRFAASWLRPGSTIRYELGNTSLDPIINTIITNTTSGYVCEEIVTASSLASSGAGGVINGPAAFKSAIRCGRTFASEQGLRQHISALHAPPGTWLCRSCGSDCGTSQARTHHERSCGTGNALVSPGSTKENSLGGGIPTVGQASKKKKSSAGAGKGHSNGGKDKNGCIRVPGYSGVWVNPKGKHFVKIDEKPLTHESDEEKVFSDDSTILFDSVEEAARMHDTVMKEKMGEVKKDLKLNFKPDGSRIVYDTTSTAAAGRNLEMLGGGASSVVPALSVINIKDLPKGVVPLLRDPKQTPRTGGNSKRHIYAYRGVCRQARKGHDRWQSQISFGGTNHYLGTFDSEWDAAAIYAWAHLILYGEDATKKAQEEGEIAVATYEQEQKDIADGKIPAPLPSKTKKKKAATKTSTATSTKGRGRKKVEKSTIVRSSSKKDLSFLEDMKPTYSKMSNSFQGMKVTSDKDDDALIMEVLPRILASRQKETRGSSYCVPVSKLTTKFPTGCALLLGLSSVDFGWNLESFYRSTQHIARGNEDAMRFLLKSEFDEDGMNTRFRTIVKGFPCFIGKASKHTEEAASTLGFYGAGLGGTIGDVDCNIGGIDGSCSEMAAVISYSQEENSFQFTACGTEDLISVNGEKVDSSGGSISIGNKAICSIGSRVFMFILASN